MKIKIIENPEVKLIAETRGKELGPKELVAFGARGTIKKADPYQLYIEAKKEGKLNEYINRILDVTIGSGHIDVLDQAIYTFIFKEVPRLTTLFLVSPPYLSHLQQSMRYVEPYGIYIPNELRSEKKIIENMKYGIYLYYELVEKGVPKEDARFVIPLYTVTNILTVGNMREYTHIYLMAREKDTPPINRKVIETALSQVDKELIKDRGANYVKIRYYPAPNLFSKYNYIKDLIKKYGKNKVSLISYNEPIDIDEEQLKKAIKYGDESYLGILKHLNYTFLVRMSLVTYHQAVRQRTWNHHVESIYHALERLDYIVPPSIQKKGLEKPFKKYIEETYNIYKEYRESYPEKIIIGIVSHAHTVYDLIRIDGWNYVGAIPLRRCLRAQWEIRMIMSDISRQITKINKKLGKYSLPTCRTIGECFEKRPCQHIEKLLAMKPLITI